MLDVFSLLFVANAKISFRYDFAASLKRDRENFYDTPASVYI